MGTKRIGRNVIIPADLFFGGRPMSARKTRAFVALLGLSPLLFAQKQISVADCTFVANTDEYLGRSARARNVAYGNVRAMAFRALANVAVDSVSRRNFIDDEIFSKLTLRGAPAAPFSSDEEFFRRISLDLTGRLPDPADIRAFLADAAASKRDALIDKLLASTEFTDRWTMWMGDWLQNTSTLVNAAVNRGVTGRNAFHNYLRESVKTDKSLRTVATDRTARLSISLAASRGMGGV